MGKLDGKVALITGGGRGQGAAEAELFSSEGASVVLTDVLADDGERSAAACGGRFLFQDVTDEDRWTSIVDQILAWHGRLDVLINNAGIAPVGRLVDSDLAAYRRVIDVNQVGVYLGMGAVSRPMIEQQSGSIVNISSISGMSGIGGLAYVASKWAVRGMTHAAAIELARHGIRVNSIHPGLIDTPMLQGIPGSAAFTANILPTIPMRRVGTAAEVAKLALFLASEDSSYSTGAEFVVDGGWMA